MFHSTIFNFEVFHLVTRYFSSLFAVKGNWRTYCKRGTFSRSWANLLISWPIADFLQIRTERKKKSCWRKYKHINQPLGCNQEGNLPSFHIFQINIFLDLSIVYLKKYLINTEPENKQFSSTWRKGSSFDGHQSASF